MLAPGDDASAKASCANAAACRDGDGDSDDDVSEWMVWSAGDSGGGSGGAGACGASGSSALRPPLRSRCSTPGSTHRRRVAGLVSELTNVPYLAIDAFRELACRTERHHLEIEAIQHLSQGGPD